MHPFIKQVLAFPIGLFILALYPLYGYVGSLFVWSLAAGWAISLVNTLASYLVLRWAFDKPARVFNYLLFGGMLVRLLGTGLLFLGLLLWTGVDIVGLVLSLFVFYTLFQILELRFIHQNLRARKRAAQNQSKTPLLGLK